jgi:putative ABC transport system permease protein
MKLSWIKIAWRNLGERPLQTILSVILLGFGVGMVSLMMLSERQLTDAFERNIKDIDLVLGAKGSPLQLILANIYHVDAPTGNIDYESAKRIARHPYIASSIPLAYGDNYQGYRIVGTETSYPEHYDVALAEGQSWEGDFEVVFGSVVAEETGLGLGDTFFSSHGLLDDENVHDNLSFRVVGIYAKSRSVIDQLILCSIPTVWGVHEDVEGAPKEITAMLLEKRNPMAVLTIPRLLSETNMQVALPSIEANRLTQNFGLGMGTLRAIAWMIMLLSFASIFISVYDSMLKRRYELALMRTMGASPGGLFVSLLLEGGLLSLMGVLLGGLVSRTGMLLLAETVADKFHYDLAAMAPLASEVILAGSAIFVGLIAAALPGLSALNLDISRTLSESN